MATTLNGTALMASLTVNDIQASLAFFKALGFAMEEPWEENGTLMGAMVRAGAVRLGVMQDDGKKGANRVKGTGMRLYIEAEVDIDAAAASAKAAGVALTREPHDTDWGTRAFDVTEPSGFLITIATASKPRA
jgi:uncharacterized glyoxalase superfamily protein PhnB